MSNFRSWLSAFGTGTCGIFLSFIGIGTFPAIYYYFENSSWIYFSGYIGILGIPILILIIGSVSFYYGIKIIKNND